MHYDEIKLEIESKLGPVTTEEFEFAVEQFERNCSQAKTSRRLYDDTLIDMLSTNIDYFRRNKLSKDTNLV